MDSTKSRKYHILYREINLSIAGLAVLFASQYCSYLSGVRNSHSLYLLSGVIDVFIMPPFIIYVIISSRRRWQNLESFQRLWLICLLCILPCANILIATSVPFLRDVGFKKRIMTCGELEQIQTDVEEFLATLPSNVQSEIPREMWSERIKCIDPSYIWFQEDPRPHLYFIWGGAFGGYRGIVVGDSLLQRNSSGLIIFNQWKPGFYGYYNLE